MNNEIVGKILNKSVQEGTKQDGNPFKKEVIDLDDNHKYSVFFPNKLNLDALKIGDLVKIEYEQRGSYRNIKAISKNESSPVAMRVSEPVSPQTCIHLNRTERPNSYEFGKAGNRFKLYFDKPAELVSQIEALKELGLYQDETSTTRGETPSM